MRLGHDYCLTRSKLKKNKWGRKTNEFFLRERALATAVAKAITKKETVAVKEKLVLHWDTRKGALMARPTGQRLRFVKLYIHLKEENSN